MVFSDASGPGGSSIAKPSSTGRYATRYSVRVTHPPVPALVVLCPHGVYLSRSSLPTARGCCFPTGVRGQDVADWRRRRPLQGSRGFVVLPDSRGFDSSLRRCPYMCGRRHSMGTPAAVVVARPVHRAPTWKLKKKFNRNLNKFRPSHADSNTDRKRRLFQNWETYEASLPVRQHDVTKEFLKLYKLPYWGSDEDIDTMVTQLERVSGARGIVKYVCAPGASGKTTSIVPAFLKSKRFTHYLCLAFDNNGHRSFVLAPYKPDEDEEIAEKQGGGVRGRVRPDPPREARQGGGVHGAAERHPAADQ